MDEADADGQIHAFQAGGNGSGKSAVLLAISVGLGATPRGCGRQLNLADLIRRGPEGEALPAVCAQIDIRLRNGRRGFRYRLYGEEIIVTRYIYSSCSKLHIDRSACKPGSDSSSELEAILLALGVCPRSPLTLMHQDIVGGFFFSSAVHGYRFLTESLGMSQTRQEISLLMQERYSMEEDLALAEQALTRLAEIRDEWRHAVQLADTAQGIQARVADLQSELAWAQQREAFEICATAREHRSYCASRLALADEHLLTLRAALSNAAMSMDELESVHETACCRIASICERARFAGLEICSLEAAVSGASLRERHAKVLHERASVELTRAAWRLLQAHTDAATVAADRASRCLRMTEELRAAHASQRERIDCLGEAADLCSHRLAQARAALSAARARELSLRSAAAAASRRQEKICSPQSFIPPEAGHLFEMPPIGPIREFVSVLDPLWSAACNQIVGKMMDSYIVASHADAVALRQFARHRGTVYVAQCYHLSDSPVPCGSVMGKLRIRSAPIQCRCGVVDPALVIRSVLRDVSGAESVMCLPDEESAARAAKSLHCETISPSGVRFRCPAAFPVLSRLSTCDPDLSVPVWGEATGNLSRTDSIKMPLREAVAEIEAAARECKDAALLYRRARLDLDQATYVLGCLQTEMESVAERAARAETIDPSLVRRHNQAAESHSRKEGALSSARSATIAASKALSEAKTGMEALQSEADAAQCEVERAFQSVLTARLDMDSKHSAVERAARDRQSLASELDQATTEERRGVADAERLLRVARGAFARGEGLSGNGRRAEEIRMELQDECDRLLEINRSRPRQLEWLRPHLELAEQRYSAQLRQCQDMRQLVPTLVEAVGRRAEVWHRISRCCGRRITAAFSNLVRSRFGGGRVAFAHDTRRLTVTLRPIGEDREIDSSRLSGGEKSFALTALLLAAWRVIMAPFQGADEFDVCLDPFNRENLLSFLVETALECGSQFLFVTPLDLRTVPRSEDVCVWDLDASKA